MRVREGRGDEGMRIMMLQETSAKERWDGVEGDRIEGGRRLEDREEREAGSQGGVGREGGRQAGREGGREG